MKQDNQLSLCDPHNSIIHEYGCESSCTKTAAICRKGCSEYEHKQKVSKHQFMHAREFYTIVSHLRQDYVGFSANFKEVYLKRYINEIKQALKTFQENIFTKIDDQNSLVDIYSRNSGEIFQTILEDKYEDIQFAQLKCKEVFQLKCFYNTLTKSNPDQQEKRVMKILTKMLEDHLRNLKLIPLPVKPQKQQKNKHLCVVQGDNMEEVTLKIKQNIRKIESKQIPERFEEIFVKIRERLHEQRESPELQAKLNTFFETHHHFLQLNKVQEYTLAVKGIVSACSFWLQFINFIGREKIKSLKVMTSEQTQQSKSLQNEIQMMNRQKFSIKFVTGDWQNSLEPLIAMLSR